MFDFTARLPDELRVYILELSNKPDVVRIAGVSRTWRNVARTHKSYFLDITICLQSSESRPLPSPYPWSPIEDAVHAGNPMVITIISAKDDDARANMFGPLMEHVVYALPLVLKLHLLLFSTRYCELALERLAGQDFPRLQRLALHSHGAGGVISDQLLSGQAPRLKELHISGFRLANPFLLSCQGFRGVQELTLSRTTLQDLRLDSSFPNLRSLNVFLDSIYPATEKDNVRLPASVAYLSVQSEKYWNPFPNTYIAHLVHPGLHLRDIAISFSESEKADPFLLGQYLNGMPTRLHLSLGTDNPDDPMDVGARLEITLSAALAPGGHADQRWTRRFLKSDDYNHRAGHFQQFGITSRFLVSLDVVAAHLPKLLSLAPTFPILESISLRFPNLPSTAGLAWELEPLPIECWPIGVQSSNDIRCPALRTLIVRALSPTCTCSVHETTLVGIAKHLGLHGVSSGRRPQLVLEDVELISLEGEARPASSVRENFP